MRRRIAVPIATLAVALLGASAAEAATLSVTGNKDCYRVGDTLTLSGTGYTPGGPVNVTFEGRQFGTLTADAAGNITTGSLPVGGLRGVSQRTFVATDATNPALTATTQFLGAALVVKVRPQSGAAGRKLRVSASGFTTGKRLYAHIRRKGYLRTVLIGKLKGPCHTLKKRKRVLTAATPNGIYTVQFDTRKRYSKKTKVWYRFRVTVT
jgi:lipoprotein-anchoring transpeptidase ErfK/SrfK